MNKNILALFSAFFDEGEKLGHTKKKLQLDICQHPWIVRNLPCHYHLIPEKINKIIIY
jgi:hypothetical protein